MEKPWSMYNKVEKLRIDDLKSEHVKIILLAIPTSKMQDWYACQEASPTWYPISDIPDFYEEVRQIKSNTQVDLKDSGEATPPPPPRRPMFEDAPTGAMATASTLKIENISTRERRTARRYPRHLGFKISQGAQTFNCDTLDISMSGIALEQDLPAWVPKTFQAELVHQGRSIRILCKRVDNSKLKLVDADAWNLIRQWLIQV